MLTYLVIATIVLVAVAVSVVLMRSGKDQPPAKQGPASNAGAASEAKRSESGRPPARTSDRPSRRPPEDEPTLAKPPEGHPSQPDKVISAPKAEVAVLNGRTEPAPPPTHVDDLLPPAARASRPVFPSGVDHVQEEEGSGPNRLVLVTAVGMTDPGLKRKHNEDAYVMLPNDNLYAIADGMGMHAAGEVASKLTIEAIADAFENKLYIDDSDSKPGARGRRLVRIVEHANRIVLAMANEVEAYHGMGTTVVMAYFSPSKERMYVAHVGDSRCYRIRGDEMKQLTVDHTLGNVGIIGKTSSILTRAVGIEENVDVDINMDHPQPKDIYLLCSDGLSRMTTDAKILETVRTYGDIDEATRKLIELAKEGGGRDNITTILIRVDPVAS